MRQHARIVPGDNVIELINQLGPSERDVCSALLKVFDCKHLILVTIAVPVFIDMIAETTGNVSAIVGDRLSVEDHQHPFQVCQAIALPAPVQPKPPPVTFDQPCDDDFRAKLAGAVCLKIPR